MAAMSALTPIRRALSARESQTIRVLYAPLTTKAALQSTSKKQEPIPSRYQRRKLGDQYERQVCDWYRTEAGNESATVSIRELERR